MNFLVYEASTESVFELLLHDFQGITHVIRENIVYCMHVAFLNSPKSIILISLPFSKQACFDVDSIFSSRVVGDGSVLVILRFSSAIVSFLEMVMNFGRGILRPRPSD